MSIKRIFSSHAFQSPCSLPLNGPLVSLLFLSSQAVLNANSFFSCLSFHRENLGRHP